MVIGGYEFLAGGFQAGSYDAADLPLVACFGTLDTDFVFLVGIGGDWCTHADQGAGCSHDSAGP
jgi:hypothetical protein